MIDLYVICLNWKVLTVNINLADEWNSVQFKHRILWNMARNEKPFAALTRGFNS